MAGEIVNGGAGEESESESEPEGTTNNPEFPVPIVIDTAAFKATALPMHFMPGMMVAEAMGTEDLHRKTWLMIQMFAVSLNEPGKAGDLESLDYPDLVDAMTQWVNRSVEAFAASDRFD